MGCGSRAGPAEQAVASASVSGIVNARHVTTLTDHRHVSVAMTASGIGHARLISSPVRSIGAVHSRQPSLTTSLPIAAIIACSGIAPIGSRYVRLAMHNGNNAKSMKSRRLLLDARLTILPCLFHRRKL